MNFEKLFDPTDPKYKSVVDLPEDQRPNYVDVERGFITQQAIEHQRFLLDNYTIKDKLSDEELDKLKGYARLDERAAKENVKNYILRFTGNYDYNIDLYDPETREWVASISQHFPGQVAYGYARYYNYKDLNEDEFDDKEEYYQLLELADRENQEMEENRKKFALEVERYLEFVRKYPDDFPLEVCLAAGETIFGSDRFQSYICNVGNHVIELTLTANYDGRKNSANYGTHQNLLSPYGYRLQYDKGTKFTETSVQDDEGYPIGHITTRGKLVTGRYLITQEYGKSFQIQMFYLRSYSDFEAAKKWAKDGHGFIHNSDRGTDQAPWEI